MKLKQLSSKHYSLGAKFEKNYLFQSGHQAPLFYVKTVHALNQIIGYAKFINASYGSVYYRGENELHDTLLPSIARPIQPAKTKLCILQKDLNKIISKIKKDIKLSKTIKINEHEEEEQNLIIEALLQHYGYRTHYIDVVDNHWVALWFGLHNTQKLHKSYICYKQRSIGRIDSFNNKQDSTNFQYLVLIASEKGSSNTIKGIEFGKNITTIDLRNTLPSIFLRPHAQHGLLLKINPHTSPPNYDFSPYVVGILKLSTETVSEWLGKGELISSTTLFPSPAFDHGYDILLQKEDLLKTTHNHILRYV